jgi:hypothetical protein
MNAFLMNYVAMETGAGGWRRSEKSTSLKRAAKSRSSFQREAWKEKLGIMKEMSTKTTTASEYQMDFFLLLT